MRILKLGDYIDLEGNRGMKEIKEPDYPELPEYPQGGPVAGEARWACYKAQMEHYQYQREAWKDAKKQFDKLDERHSELLSLLLQSIGEEVGLEKALEDASSPSKLVKKVKQLLQINDISTKREIECKWQQTLNQDLRKVSLDAWRDEVIKATRALKLWKSHFVEDCFPHTLAAENLTRYHPVGAQRAYTIIADATDAAKTPDFEKFMRDVTAFAAKIGGQ